MAKRYLIQLWEGDFEWIDYQRRKEVTALCNPYPAPEGTVEAIEFDPERLNEILELLGKETRP